MHHRTIGQNEDSLFLTTNTPKAIQQKRAEIARRLIARSANIKDHAITCIAPADLKILFDLYNELFFKNCFLQDFRGKMKFSLSRRLTRSAGKTICPKNMGRLKPEEIVMEIRMGVDFFFDYDAVKSEKKVNGLSCRNALEAFQLVFEHELCHVIEFISFQTSNCSRARFKNIARSLFGHLTSYHQLPTRQRIVCEKLGLAIGDPVSFIDGNQRVRGVLTKINKRATVMVRDQKGNYADREGNRYRKFLVPVELLTD
jgi:hypothetical protein